MQHKPPCPFSKTLPSVQRVKSGLSFAKAASISLCGGSSFVISGISDTALMLGPKIAHATMLEVNHSGWLCRNDISGNIFASKFLVKIGGVIIR